MIYIFNTFFCYYIIFSFIPFLVVGSGTLKIRFFIINLCYIFITSDIFYTNPLFLFFIAVLFDLVEPLKLGILDNDQVQLKVKKRDNNSLIIYIDDVGNKLSSIDDDEEVEIDETTYQSDGEYDDCTQESSVTIKIENDIDGEASDSDNNLDDGKCTIKKKFKNLYQNINDSFIIDIRTVGLCFS